MKNLWKSIKITFAFCGLLTVFYVLVLVGIAALFSPGRGSAETVSVDGAVVGAVNVGQSFVSAQYFWGRPSAVDYNGSGSGGSNKATTNPEYLAEVETRIDSFLQAHPYLTRADVPAEMVTASASGLDPDISPVSARVQIGRVAAVRGIAEKDVEKIVAENTQKPFLGLFGPEKVNVLKLNVALDEACKEQR